MVVKSEKNMNGKLQYHIKCKVKSRKILVTGVCYMVFHPRACGKYAEVKDTDCFSLRFWLYFAAVQET